jgi:hypothetical protein
MHALVVYNPRGTQSDPGIGSGSGGGHVEDILKRLGNVEADVSELKLEVRGIVAIVPHLATKTDVTDVRVAVADLRGEMNELRGEMRAGLSEVRAEMAAGSGSVRAEMAAGLGSVRAEIAAGLGSVRAEMAAGLGSVRAELSSQIGSVRSEMSAGFGALKAEMAARETAFLKWIIATVVASVGLAFTIAKFVH